VASKERSIRSDIRSDAVEALSAAERGRFVAAWDKQMSRLASQRPWVNNTSANKTTSNTPAAMPGSEAAARNSSAIKLSASFGTFYIVGAEEMLESASALSMCDLEAAMSKHKRVRQQWWREEFSGGTMAPWAGAEGRGHGENDPGENTKFKMASLSQGQGEVRYYHNNV
jgi:hypothetical protein